MGLEPTAIWFVNEHSTSLAKWLGVRLRTKWLCVRVPFILCTPTPFCRGVEPPTKFSKRGGLTGAQLLEGGCWEIGGDFFPGAT